MAILFEENCEVFWYMLALVKSLVANFWSSNTIGACHDQIPEFPFCAGVINFVLNSAIHI